MILKYKQYNESINNVLDMVVENCQPFLNMLKEFDDTPYLFYRGVPEKIEDIKVFKPLENRTPRDTQKYLHDLINKYSKKKFGWEIRNGVFVTHSKNEADRYHGIPGDNSYVTFGSTNLFLPIGDFKFLYNPNISDFTEYIYQQRMVPFSDWKASTGNNKYTKSDWQRDLRLFAQECVDDYTDKVSYYGMYGREISFNVKEYYLINLKYEGNILKLIK